MRLTASRWAFLASHTATNCTSFSGNIQLRSPVPRPPIPKPPSTIRSLGGTEPLRPRAEPGISHGVLAMPPARTVRFRNWRRLRGEPLADEREFGISGTTFDFHMNPRLAKGVYLKQKLFIASQRDKAG